jgi:hypothetical protein
MIRLYRELRWLSRKLRESRNLDEHELTAWSEQAAQEWACMQEHY